MSLVSKTLNSLSEVLKDPSKINKADEWLNLQNTIRSKYTLDADQEMFDAVLKGASIEEALKTALENYNGYAGSASFGGVEEVDDLAEFLEEQDANELGLNVIWVNEFSEIAPLIKSISST